ncbi:Gfo/Idh/MocA family protein [Paenibacillus sp. GCM10012303]|uniref:Gfo/Idh/MocA family protein n=1 Tax=Paenibacillus sp. GCM10012303 TaxID=3317340 RepID=UPI003622DE46
MGSLKIGVIGYGLRCRGMVKELVKLGGCRIAAVADPDMDNVRQKLQEDGHDARMFDSAADMLDAVALDAVMVGTRCSKHVEMAVQVLGRNLPLFLEKPVATTMQDLIVLRRNCETSRSPVVVSHPLRLTPVVRLVKEIVDSGQLGTVEHAQAYCNVPYGLVYFKGWYRDEGETGGLFLQKATHDFDYLNFILQAKPTQICAMTSKQVFKGNKPAGLKCPDCDENDTCEEGQARQWESCCYAEDTGNEDSGSALIRYESGMHVSYSQNFFVRRKAGLRGARLIGYKGTLEFDFSGKIRVFLHHKPRVDTYELEAENGHSGGDAALARNFIQVIRGEGRSISSLNDGMLSAYMCLKARESAQTGSFQQLNW